MKHVNEVYERAKRLVIEADSTQEQFVKLLEKSHYGQCVMLELFLIKQLVKNQWSLYEVGVTDGQEVAHLVGILDYAARTRAVF